MTKGASRPPTNDRLFERNDADDGLQVWQNVRTVSCPLHPQVAHSRDGGVEPARRGRGATRPPRHEHRGRRRGVLTRHERHERRAEMAPTTRQPGRDYPAGDAGPHGAADGEQRSNKVQRFRWKGELHRAGLHLEIRARLRQLSPQGGLRVLPRGVG